MVWTCYLDKQKNQEVLGSDELCRRPRKPKNPEGAAQVQDFHRQLFTSSADSLLQEIKRITGVEVREATAEVETTTGAVVHAFTTGAVVQVFLLACNVPPGAWSGDGQGKQS